MEFARIRMGALGAALAVELVDELVDGTKSAAMPLIRHDLGAQLPADRAARRGAARRGRHP